MSSYHTEQKKLLLAYLTKHKDNSRTIEEITQGLRLFASDSTSVPGKSTVYRLINKLLEEGKVKKFSKEGTRQAAYQLVEGAHCSSHLHLKCTECGRIFHMEDKLSDELISKISDDQSFVVNRTETVLYGKCRICNNKQGGV